MQAGYFMQAGHFMKVFPRYNDPPSTLAMFKAIARARGADGSAMRRWQRFVGTPHRLPHEPGPQSPARAGELVSAEGDDGRPRSNPRRRDPTEGGCRNPRGEMSLGP
jgi:hypothetical protein